MRRFNAIENLFVENLRGKFWILHKFCDAKSMQNLGSALARLLSRFTQKSLRIFDSLDCFGFAESSQ